MTVATGGLAFICTVAILVLCIKHFRLQSLVSSLGLVSLLPPAAEAYHLAEKLLTHITEAPLFLARQPK